MAYIEPDEVVARMIEAAVAKGQLPVKDLLNSTRVDGAQQERGRSPGS